MGDTHGDRPSSRHRDIVMRLSSAQKSNRGAPAYARWVNRPLGRHIAAVAYRLDRTPNQVTALSATLSLVGVGLIAVVSPDVWAGFVIAGTLLAAYAFDAADGQLARLRGGGSAAGEWLDHVVDCAKIATLHLAVVICWYRHFELQHEALLLVPLVFAAQASTFFFSIVLSEQLRRAASGTTPSALPRSDEPAPVLRSLLVAPADYAVLCLAFVSLGAHSVFVAVYTALMVLNVLYLVGALPRWYREVRMQGVG